ncbi:hypothetical protein CVT25_003173 [Psilocybe cyanescens]|uniref:Uncharacterized protein n=1 Tax=Psilocybe cyanescens TaxID=93625 RepID=A0A409XEZ6_PSICY|nr:hypothetical protein CVT25_003173 [Psilocybe cyanescens]
MSSTTQNVSASHNSGTAPTATPSNTSGDNSATASASGGDTTYPEQIHAGKVGYGPNYRTGPSLEDKIQGLKEELKGKVTRNSELVEHGRQVKSGEEKRKKLTGEGHGKGAMEQAATVAPEGTEDAERQRKGNNVDFATRPVEARQ